MTLAMLAVALWLPANAPSINCDSFRSLLKQFGEQHLIELAQQFGYSKHDLLQYEKTCGIRR